MNIKEIPVRNLTALDLRADAEAFSWYGTAYRIELPGRAQRVEVYTRDGDTYGVFTGGDSVWIDAIDATDAIERVL